jgi:hypothetical protein
MGHKTEDSGNMTVTNISNGGTVGFMAGTVTNSTITVTTNGKAEAAAAPTKNAPAPRGR